MERRYPVLGSRHNRRRNTRMKLEQSVTPELRVAIELEAHEKECAIRYASVEDKLTGLDKRLWRLEAMVMGSTMVIIGLAGSLLMKL